MKKIKLDIILLSLLFQIMSIFSQSCAQNEKSNIFPNINQRFAFQPIMGFHKPIFELGSYGDISKTTLIFGAGLHANISKRFALSLSWLHSAAKATDFQFVGDKEKLLEENEQFSNFDGHIIMNFFSIESYFYFTNKKARPFISIGIGLYSHIKKPEDGSTLSWWSDNNENQTRFGINYGVGIETFIIERLSMIFAYQNHKALYVVFDAGKLETNIFEMGINVYFKQRN